MHDLEVLAILSTESEQTDRGERCDELVASGQEGIVLQVLHTSDEVKRKIRLIFRDQRRRRVAIVAYVGKGAKTYLPNPKGLELYCWPQPGGTSAKAIRGLQRGGVDVSFADRVHMKVFWSQGHGAVVGSANLSDNALGVGGLHEAGVFLPASKVRIDSLIQRIKPVKVTAAALRKLEAAEAKRVPRIGAARRGTSTVPPFQDWYGEERSKRWKWGYFTDYAPNTVSRRARNAVREIDPTLAPTQVVFCRRSAHTDGDWILFVRLTSGGVLTVPEWVFVHRVVLVERNDRVYNEHFPFQAVQAHPLRHCPAPPFAIDSRFRKALREASLELGQGRTSRQVDGKRPTAAFLRLISERYRARHSSR